MLIQLWLECCFCLGARKIIGEGEVKNTGRIKG